MSKLSKDDIQIIKEAVEEAILPPIAKSFDKLEKRIIKVEKRLDGVGNKLGGAEKRLGGVEKRLDKNDDNTKSLTEEIQDFRQQNHLEHKSLERRLDAEVAWKDQAEKRLVSLEKK